MKKIIILLIFCISLFSDARNNMNGYRFPNTFMEDNSLVYDVDDTTRVVPKVVEEEEPKEKEIVYRYIDNREQNNMESMQENFEQGTQSKIYMYVAPTLSIRKSYTLVGFSVGSLVNDLMSTEVIVEKSVKDYNLSMITNEFSINIFHIENMRVNLLGSFSAGGILDSPTKLDKFFYGYALGGEVEGVMDRVKVALGYKLETLKVKSQKKVSSNVFFVKIKFNFLL